MLVGFLTGVGIQVALGQVGGLLGTPEGKGYSFFGWDDTGTIGKLFDTLQTSIRSAGPRWRCRPR